MEVKAYELVPGSAFPSSHTVIYFFFNSVPEINEGSLRANISETVLVLLINEQGEKEKVEMNRKSLGVVLSPGGLAGAERSGGEPGSPQRSAAPAKAGTSRPDPEVVAKAKRRTFTAEYKLRILQEV